jgi:hypothetical protein
MRSIGGERSVVGGSTLPLKVAFMAEVAAETADGLALLVDECQGRMLADHFAKLIQLAVDAFLPERRVERARVEENVDVFREPLYQAPAFGEAGAALENDPSADRLLDDAQRFGDIVIFLDEGLAQAVRTKMVRCADDGLLEVWMLT